MQISDLVKFKNPYSLMGPLILTNLLIIFDALHQKEDYCLLPNNKEKKSILPSSKIKTPTNTQEAPPSVCQVMFSVLWEMPTCYHHVLNPSLCAHTILGR